MAVGCGSGGGFGMGLLNPSDSQASVVRAGWWWRAGLLKSKVFRGRPVFRRYSAFLTLMYPIPLPALQNAAGGPVWAVLAVFCGDFDRAVSWFAAPGLVGLLDVRVLDVWMFRFLPGKRLFGCLSFVFFC